MEGSSQNTCGKKDDMVGKWMELVIARLTIGSYAL